jgi:phosphoribosyl 1,2-cyclic phosphate phosphodiesterase
LKVTFLGTGTSQGVPVIACSCEVCRSTNTKDSRLRSSLLLEINGINIVIDSGPDFRQQMLNANVKSLDAILFTHEHRDHIAGLDDIRAYNYIQQQPMDVYAEERVQHAIKQEFDYIFAEHKYPGVPQVNMHVIDPHPFEVHGIRVIPIRAMHLRLPVLGFRIGDITYITDTNFISEEEKHKIKGSKHIILSGLRKEKHISHFSLSEAIQVIQEFNPVKGYITHISHQMGLHNEVQAELPSNIVLAYDNLQIEVN